MNWMLTGARCGHHAKVTVETLLLVSEEAAPPHRTFGSQYAGHLAAPRGYARTLTRLFLATAGVIKMDASLGFPQTAVGALAPLGGKVAS